MLRLPGAPGLQGAQTPASAEPLPDREQPPLTSGVPPDASDAPRPSHRESAVPKGNHIPSPISIDFGGWPELGFKNTSARAPSVLTTHAACACPLHRCRRGHRGWHKGNKEGWGVQRGPGVASEGDGHSSEPRPQNGAVYAIWPYPALWCPERSWPARCRLTGSWARTSHVPAVNSRCGH